MAVKEATVREWVKVLVPVAYLALMLAASYGGEVGSEVKFYYYSHRVLGKVTRWSRKWETEMMERYYDAVNQGW
jgi:NADPH-dependent 2,4-dienoyl-CoA reductase/sulfur reductase-like enzyme